MKSRNNEKYSGEIGEKVKDEERKKKKVERRER